MQSLRALMPLPTSWYICEYMQVGEFLHVEEGQEEVVTFNILLHAIPVLYYTRIRSSEGGVFFFTDNESAPRGGNIAFSVSDDVTSACLSYWYATYNHTSTCFLNCKCFARP